jgi:general secretion pathway protein J
MKMSKGNNRGFTLLELLLAMALLVILSGAVYGTYFSVMKGREAATVGMEARRELSMTLDMLRNELASATFTRNNKRYHFVVEDRDLFGKPASTLEFTTITQPNDDTVPTSDMVVVKYAPKDTAGRMSLMRQASDIYLNVKPFSYPQVDEIEGFLVECYDGSKWVKSWDTALNAGGLPRGVKITLRVREGGMPMDFTTFAIPRINGT